MEAEDDGKHDSAYGSKGSSSPFKKGDGVRRFHRRPSRQLNERAHHCFGEPVLAWPLQGKWLKHRLQMSVPQRGKKRVPPSESILRRGVFNCFSCHESGDIRRLLRLMGASRETIDAELKSIQPSWTERESFTEKYKRTSSEKRPVQSRVRTPEAFLGVYDWMPTKLVGEGIRPTPATRHGDWFRQKRQSNHVSDSRYVQGTSLGSLEAQPS